MNLERPKIVHIEPTSYCNLRCFHCAMRNRDYQGRTLPFDAFVKLLPAIAHWKPHIMLNGHGECLMHPQYDDMFLRLAGLGCTVEFQSNGALLSDERIRKFTETTKWTQFTISVDGIGEVYEKVRGVSFQNVTRVLQKIGTSAFAPKLALEYVAMKLNIHHLTEVAKLAVASGARLFLISDLIEYENTVGQAIDWREHADKLTEAKRICDTGNCRLDLSAISSDASGIARGRFTDEPALCRVPNHAIYIRATGKVFPCCRVSQPVGDIYEEAIEDIWQGAAFTEFRSRLAAGAYCPDCANCKRVETVK